MAKLEEERLSLETAYREALLHALMECSKGRWGLFGQNDSVLSAHIAKRLVPDSVKAVRQIGEELTELRERLGFTDLYAPMQRLNELRSKKGANQLGEARLADLLLGELLDQKQ